MIGPGHAVDGSPNQDSLLLRRFDGCFLSVVCDGMGSKSQSHIGSRLACLAAYDVIRSADFEVDGKILIEKIYQHWLFLLGGVNRKVAVTTCLICWGNSAGVVRYFQLGDGRIIASGIQVKDEGTNFGNETTGLGVSGKYSDWFVGDIVLEKNQGLAMMTDGISEDLEAGCENQLLTSLVGSMKGLTTRRAKKTLVQELSDWPTPNHLDDKTIAVVIR